MENYITLLYKQPIWLFVLAVVFGSMVTIFYIKLTTDTTPKIIKKVSSNLTRFNTETAPTDSLKGSIATFSGIVKWQSRIATEAAQIYSLVPIQQGEQIETDDSGKVTVEFPGAFLAKISPDSKIDFVQTLPVNIVMVQKKGIVEYQKLGDKEISIRALHLLIEQISGDTIVSIDKDKSLIIVQTKKGTVKTAYNDSQNISQEVIVDEDKQLTFNDETREITLR